MEDASSSKPRKKKQCVVIKPPKAFASVRTVGTKNSRPKRRQIGQLNGAEAAAATSDDSEGQCFAQFAPATQAAADASRSRVAAKRINDSEAHAERWREISHAQVNAYSQQLQPSCDTATLCHECWQEVTTELHQCIWQLRAQPTQGLYPLRTTIADTLDLNLPESHVSRCNHGHSFVSISVFDQRARIRQCRVQTCDGEQVAVSLVRHNLWPATPKQPQKAVHIALMEQIYEFVVGSHISLYRACQALQSFGYQHTETSAQSILYKTINRFLSFRFFRRFAQRIFFLRDVQPTKCDACPKDDTSELFVSMDACFGLVHKLNTRHRIESAQPEESQFLCKQQHVQEFVRRQNTDTIPHCDDAVACSSFSAGDTVIAATKNRGLAVKGVFGASCRHQSPLKFLDMQHGERYSYPTYLLRNLQTDWSDTPTTVLYDIACKFSKYFKRSEPTLYDSITFKLPVFHSYAHSLACQLEFNPRIDGSCGLCDGEGEERLWSMLQQSSKSMKEMTAGNRISFFDDILHHYTAKQNESLLGWIKRRFAFALRIEKESQEKLDEILPTIDTDATPSKCSEWLAEILASLSKPTANRSQLKQNEWQRTYVATIDRLESLRQQIRRATNAAELTRLQDDESSAISTLEQIETRHHIVQRWQCDDIIFRSAQDQLRMEQILPVLQSLFKASAELQQFLELMKKFCPGQDASNRIKRCVKQARRSLLSNLNKYNQTSKPQSPRLPLTLQENEVCSPETPRWAELQLLTQCTNDVDPLISQKLAAIQAYGSLKSAKVEQRLLKADSRNLIRGISQKIQLLTEQTDDSLRNETDLYPLFAPAPQRGRSYTDCRVRLSVCVSVCV